jgi:hypothetical protein
VPRVNLKRAVSFFTENLIDVPIWYFLKIEVPSVMRIEIYGLKNKVVKTQKPNVYLTLNFIR